MKTKLTLILEYKIFNSAKKYAQKKGKSLSHLVENYLKSISTKETNTLLVSPNVLKLRGIIKLPNDFDYKSDLSNVLSKKYKK